MRTINAPELTGDGPHLSPGSRLEFRDLSVVCEGTSYLVGDPAAGVFLAIPEVGMVALRELRAGGTVQAASQAAARQAGQEVDGLDFAATLLAAGLVAAVDGTPLRSGAAPSDKRWMRGVPRGLARPVFSRTAWTIYGLLFVGCLALFALRPDYWPRSEDLFFYPDPAICAVTATLLAIMLTGFHEAGHWLAARAAGVGARFTIDRRLFFPVFETDLTQLWSVPRRQRISPFLAGMAFDTVVLAACLCTRVAWGTGLVDVPPLLLRVCGAIALIEVLSLGWQTLVFLRTDLYAVLVTALGCFDLYRVAQLSLLGNIRRLDATGRAQLAHAHPRDRQVARWFACLCLIGLTWAAVVFVAYFAPATALMAGWLFASLSGAPVASTAFWEAAVLGVLAALQALLPLAILGWQRLRKHTGGGR